MFQLVILDFDGTLFDTHDSIEHCVTETFRYFQPSQPPDASEVRRLIGKGTGLYDTFDALKPNPDIYDQNLWETKYRELYALEGQALIKAFPGSKELLEHLKASCILASIVTNKGVMAVHTALTNNGLDELIPPELVVGDKTPGNITRKPDPGCYTNCLGPTLEAGYGIKELNSASILVVGDTEADIRLAHNLGAKSCYCKYGYGSDSECSALRPDFTVDALRDVIALLQP